MESWLFIIWANLSALRFMLCLLPQTGYIFPDEFFQSPEVMAGDILGLMSHRTWEWNSTAPARTIVFPALSSGLPFMLLKWVDFITPYTVVLFPRLWMTTLSFIGDRYIYRIARKLYGQRVYADVAAVLYASSFVTIVFCTRTFSNALEMIFLAFLLDTVLDKKREHSLEELIVESVLIAVTSTLGFFIRPSYPCFALVPITYWLFKKFDQKKISSSLYDAFLRGFSLFITIISMAMNICLWDNMYHRPALFNQVSPLNNTYIGNIIAVYKSPEILSKMSFTPINNMLYNLNFENLKKHGLHYRLVHSLVNLPMLFGPLFVLYIGTLVKASQRHVAIQSKTVFHVLNLTFLSGLMLMSYIPHQEPRFILPLIVPIIIVCAKYFYPFSSSRVLTTSWVSWNILGFIFFGLVHQGGMLPCLEYLNALAKAQTDLRHLNPARGNDMTVLFYHTYMPPRHLMAWKANSYNEGLNNAPAISIIDYSGAKFSQLELALDIVFSNPAKNLDFILVFPESIAQSDKLRLQNRYKMELLFHHFPHFSSEDIPPDLWNNLDQLDLSVYHVRGSKVQPILSQQTEKHKLTQPTVVHSDVGAQLY